MSIILALGLLAVGPVSGGTSLVATEVIRAGDAIREANTEPEDGVLSEEDRELFGREVRRTVYRGNVIADSNTQPRRLVKRNQPVTVKFQRRGLEITLTGRAMEDGSVGDPVSVMNIDTRQLINGEIMPEGWVLAQ